MAICPTCHAEVIEGARFCQECGTRLTPSMPPQSSPVAERVHDAPPSDAGSTPIPIKRLDIPTLLVPPPDQQPDEATDDTSNETTQGLPPLEPPDAATLAASNQTTQGLPVVEHLLAAATRVAGHQATQALPVVEQPDDAEPQRPDNAYRTMFLPSTAAEELRKQQEEWHRLAEGELIQPGVLADQTDQDAPTMFTPAVPSAGETPTILPPSGDSGSETPTLLPPSGEPLPPVNTPPPPASAWGQATLPSQPPPATGELPPLATPAAYRPFDTQSSAPALGPGAPVQQPNTARRQLYWILGGIGCLLLILLAACVIFFLVVIGRSAGTGGLSLAAATATRLSLATSTARPVISVISATTGPIAAQSTAVAGASTATFNDDFSDPKRSSLAVGNDKETVYAFENGTYAITVKVARLLAWSAFDGTYGDTKAQVDATLTSGSAATAAALIFRYQDNSNFYVYNVASDGRYNLEMMRDNTLTTLVDWTPSPAIKAKGETNLLRLETQGNRIALYVNDTKLEETSDNTFSKGQMALAVNTFDEGDAKVVFDNLLVDTE